MRNLLVLIYIFIPALCQSQDKAFIKLVEPLKEINTVKITRNFLIGSTCKTCNLTVNGIAVKVYPTGAFAYELNLKTGDTTFNMIAVASAAQSVTKKVTYHYSLPLFSQ